MIGRQQLHFGQREMRQLWMSCGRDVSNTGSADICNDAAGYSENFFRFLGAETAHSFDYSDYENPTYTHDMNEPIPEGFKDVYTAVLDGGSLEHIFNFPTAIKNCMEMVKVGGHYLAITPANNFFGHGFYQFSPELYFTVLSAKNGFRVEKIIAFEDMARPVWYAVKSPREIAERVTLRNSFPVYLFVIARKTARTAIFERIPQQSDYVALWNQHEAVLSTNTKRAKSGRRPLIIRIAKTLLPPRLRAWTRRAFKRSEPKRRGFDPRFFERMDWPVKERSALGRSRRAVELQKSASAHHFRPSGDEDP